MPVFSSDYPPPAHGRAGFATHSWTPRAGSPTSSVSSSDGRSSADDITAAPLRNGSPTLFLPGASVVQPSEGVKPTRSSIPTSPVELTPYTPPHPTPQDSLEARARPVEEHRPPKNRQRRSRTIYSDRQLLGMETCFRMTRYPDIHMREALAMSLGMKEARVQVWFQNRRARVRREERSRKRNQQSSLSDVCQSDDVSSSRRFSSVTSELSTEDGPEEEQEIDVVSVSEENNPVFRNQTSEPSETSNQSASSLAGSTTSASSLAGQPLFTIPPPEVCTKPCCSTPIMLRYYPWFPYRLPTTIPHHRGVYPSRTFGLPPTPTMTVPAPLMYGQPPNGDALAYRLQISRENNPAAERSTSVSSSS